MIKDYTFYFGEVPDEFKEDHNASIPEDWDPDYYFRIRVIALEGEIKLEDSCGRMVPFLFENINELIQELQNTQKYLVDSILGNK